MKKQRSTKQRYRLKALKNIVRSFFFQNHNPYIQAWMLNSNTVEEDIRLLFRNVKL